jgi:hypothetical protein
LPADLIASVGAVLAETLEQRDLLLVERDLAAVVPVRGLLGLGGGLEPLRAPRVAGDQHEAVGRRLVARDLEVVFGLVRHVVRAEVGRLAVLADVRAQEREVAGVARPLPVVDLAAVVADARRRRVHQAHVADLDLLDLEELRALEVAGDRAADLRTARLAGVVTCLRRSSICL